MSENDKKYQAYYTNSAEIVNYMISKLDLKGTETILEPAAGEGVFIDYIIHSYPEVTIDAFEFNRNTYEFIKEKYQGNKRINTFHEDTLLSSHLLNIPPNIGHYDAIIANPPYGAWRSIEERKDIKNLYTGMYTKESYSLFLYRCIKSLKNGGKLSFIIPDTYLNLHMHSDIRKFILRETKISEIALFPSSFFPSVNFGYANLSIISLEKTPDININLNNELTIISEYKSVNELGDKSAKHLTHIKIKQGEVLKSHSSSFLLNSNKAIINCINSSKINIGDICDCVTGFYSGCDKEFLQVKNIEIRNAKRYRIVDESLVKYNSSIADRNGIIDDNKEFIPIVKGGNQKYLKPSVWFMHWTKSKVDFYKKDKKSRFQNSEYYFKNGLAVPMISSSSITASLIENRLIDQSIVGVYPKSNKYLYYLLAFFNSPTCNELIRTINSSANNSANYIKKIPFIPPSEDILNKINNRVLKILSETRNSREFDINLEVLNNIDIKTIYGF